MATMRLRKRMHVDSRAWHGEHWPPLHLLHPVLQTLTCNLAIPIRMLAFLMSSGFWLCWLQAFHDYKAEAAELERARRNWEELRHKLYHRRTSVSVITDDVDHSRASVGHSSLGAITYQAGSKQAETQQHSSTTGAAAELTQQASLTRKQVVGAKSGHRHKRSYSSPPLHAFTETLSADCNNTEAVSTAAEVTAVISAAPTSHATAATAKVAAAAIAPSSLPMHSKLPKGSAAKPPRHRLKGLFHSVSLPQGVSLSQRLRQVVHMHVTHDDSHNSDEQDALGPLMLTPVMSVISAKGSSLGAQAGVKTAAAAGACSVCNDRRCSGCKACTCSGVTARPAHVPTAGTLSGGGEADSTQPAGSTTHKFTARQGHSASGRATADSVDLAYTGSTGSTAGHPVPAKLLGRSSGSWRKLLRRHSWCMGPGAVDEAADGAGRSGASVCVELGSAALKADDTAQLPPKLLQLNDAPQNSSHSGPMSRSQDTHGDSAAEKAGGGCSPHAPAKQHQPPLGMPASASARFTRPAPLQIPSVGSSGLSATHHSFSLPHPSPSTLRPQPAAATQAEHCGAAHILPRATSERISSLLRPGFLHQVSARVLRRTVSSHGTAQSAVHTEGRPSGSVLSPRSTASVAAALRQQAANMLKALRPQPFIPRTGFGTSWQLLEVGCT